MHVTTYRGEASVGELADRLFHDLDGPAAARAEEALLRANPHLADLGSLRPGAVLTVPDVGDLRPRAPDRGDDPDAVRLDELRASLKAYTTRLEERHDAQVEALTAELQLASSEEVREAMQDDAELLEEAIRALDARRERLQRERDRHAEVLRDLATRLDRR